MMNLSFIQQELETKGYCVIDHVLEPSEVKLCIDAFQIWQNSIPHHDIVCNELNYHGIYKFHNAGHTWHSWFVRTHPRVQEIFKYIWNCNELIVSFDGCCYIPKYSDKKDTCWTHTDQAPCLEGFHCVQGFVSFTENKERTFVVYEGSHKLHQPYFQERNCQSNNNFQVIDPEFLASIIHTKKILHVKPGSLVLWDSRTFHQNQFGAPNSETRMIQYVCFYPKDHPTNTDDVKQLRKQIFNARRTTTHWPAPPHIIPLQPSVMAPDWIDYDIIPLADLSCFRNLIDDIL